MGNFAGIGFLVSLKNGDWMTMAVSVLSVNVVSAQSFIYCYLGDYLISESEEVVKAVYCGLWYNMDSKLQKDMLFVMKKAENPVSLTGKFFTMSRQTFITILKTSGSYLSVLRIALEKQS